jgi:hypothetical protein
VRRARATTTTVVPGDRYVCLRVVEEPGAFTALFGAAATNCGPCPQPLCIAVLQAPVAGAGGSPGPCTIRAPAASPIEGTAPLLRGPRRGAVRDEHPSRAAVTQAGVPAVGPRGAAGAAGWAPASSGGVLASFLLWQVGCTAKWPRARSAIGGSRSEPRRRPTFQPRAGTHTCHRAQQSLWSPAPGARRRAPRSATPPLPFRQTAKSQNFTFIDPTNRGHSLSN